MYGVGADATHDVCTAALPVVATHGPVLTVQLAFLTASTPASPAAEQPTSLKNDRTEYVVARAGQNNNANANTQRSARETAMALSFEKRKRGRNTQTAMCRTARQQANRHG